MSGLPIMPAMPTAVVARQREATPQTQPAPGQGIAAPVRTLTSTAVHQPPAAQKLNAPTQQVQPSPPERRARLVGPPPTFDINILQDMHDARKSPTDPDMPEIGVPRGDPRAMDTPDDAGPDPTPHLSGYGSYLSLRGLATTEEAADTTLDRSV